MFSWKYKKKMYFNIALDKRGMQMAFFLIFPKKTKQKKKKKHVLGTH